MVSQDFTFHINNWLFKDVINNKETCSKPIINFVMDSRGRDRMVVRFTLTS